MTVSNQAQRLRRIGKSRQTIRANLSIREAASEARRYGVRGVR